MLLKNVNWDHLISIMMATIKIIEQTVSVGEDVKKLESLCTVGKIVK